MMKILLCSIIQETHEYVGVGINSRYVKYASIQSRIDN